MRGREHLVVAARRETAEAGLEVLDEGGNAVDAAVCMAFTAAVVEPTETSIGGSGFLLLDDPRCGSPVSVEFGPRAPSAADPDLADLTRPGSSGPLMPCVPGVVAGLGLAHAQFGSLPWQRMFEPAIAFAEDGFQVDEYLCLQTLDHLEALRADSECARIFLRDGLPLVPQFAMHRHDREPPELPQPELASTLQTLAGDGAEAFYRGGLAADFAEGFAGQGGVLSARDLARYQPTMGPPRAERYRGWKLFAPAAPCGASTVFDALRRLERFDPSERDVLTAVAVGQTFDALRSAFIDRDTHAGDVADAGHGTTHLCAVDSHGRLVSCTTTLGETFGSKFIAPGTGVLFDSGLAWFDSTDGPNAIAGWRRPLVNMSPLLLRGPDGRRGAVGAAGGRRIISAVTQVVAAIIDHGLHGQEAIDMPRLDASERLLRLSDRVPQATFEALRQLGHEVSPVPEEHAPFSYELARPAVAEVLADGRLAGGIHPFATGYVAAR